MNAKKRLSGAAYRKKAREEASKLASVVSKTANLRSYFPKLLSKG